MRHGTKESGRSEFFVYVPAWLQGPTQQQPHNSDAAEPLMKTDDTPEPDWLAHAHTSLRDLGGVALSREHSEAASDVHAANNEDEEPQWLKRASDSLMTIFNSENGHGDEATSEPDWTCCCSRASNRVESRGSTRARTVPERV